jgi:hypothetical protein
MPCELMIQDSIWYQPATHFLRNQKYDSVRFSNKYKLRFFCNFLYNSIKYKQNKKQWGFSGEDRLGAMLATSIKGGVWRWPKLSIYRKSKKKTLNLWTTVRRQATQVSGPTRRDRTTLSVTRPFKRRSHSEGLTYTRKKIKTTVEKIVGDDETEM